MKQIDEIKIRRSKPYRDIWFGSVLFKYVLSELSDLTR